MPTATEAPAAGRTALRLELCEGRVRFTGAAEGPADRPRLRPILLSSDDVSARVSLVPEGALLLDGDRVEVRVAVGAGARLELVEPGGTVAYDMRGGRATWDVDVRLGAGASLVWHGEPFVVSAGADVRRRTRVTMAEDACLALREVLVLGRQGEGPGTIDQRLDVTYADGAPVLVEHLRLDTHSAPGALGGRRVLSSCVLIGLPSPGDAETLVLEQGGSITRRVADDAHAATLEPIWHAAVAGVRGC